MKLEPLIELRVTTPRLELRFPSDGELRDLYRVAAAGIHPPEEMPFFVPWTDDLNEDSFLAFHRQARETWSPAEWSCNLGTFLDGRLIGTQGIDGKDFARARVVETGSWLGAGFQRRGYGLEQRAAVLELAFRGLGASAATSGALIHNVASQRISAKLGYRMTGTRQIAPPRRARAALRLSPRPGGMAMPDPRRAPRARAGAPAIRRITTGGILRP